MAAKKKRKPNKTIDEMREVVAYANEHSPGAALKKYAVTYGQLSNFRKTLARKSPAVKDALKAAQTNGLPPGEIKTRLQIIGMTPLIRELLMVELAPIVRQELPGVVLALLNAQKSGN